MKVFTLVKMCLMKTHAKFFSRSACNFQIYDSTNAKKILSYQNFDCSKWPDHYILFTQHKKWYYYVYISLLMTYIEKKIALQKNIRIFILKNHMRGIYQNFIFSILILNNFYHFFGYNVCSKTV